MNLHEKALLCTLVGPSSRTPSRLAVSVNSGDHSMHVLRPSWRLRARRLGQVAQAETGGVTSIAQTCVHLDRTPPGSVAG